MRLHIMSDLHLEHSTFEMPETKSDVLVLAGDILAPGHKAMAWAACEKVSRGRPVVQVAGNHEFYGQKFQAERGMMTRAAHGTGVHFLDRTSVMIDGVRFLGCTLWTDYEVPIEHAGSMCVDPVWAMMECSITLHDHISVHWQESGGSTRLLTPQDLLGQHRLDRAWLQRQLCLPFDGPTVVITHHAPHPSSIAPRYSNDWVTCGFANALPESFFDVPVLWTHGHTHTRFDYKIGDCRVVCNPRGYPFRDGRDGDYEVQGFDSGLVIEV